MDWDWDSYVLHEGKILLKHTAIQFGVMLMLNYLDLLDIGWPFLVLLVALTILDDREVIQEAPTIQMQSIRCGVNAIVFCIGLLLPAAICSRDQMGKINCHYGLFGSILLTFMGSLILVSFSRTVITGSVLLFECLHLLWNHLNDEIE